MVVTESYLEYSNHHWQREIENRPWELHNDTGVLIFPLPHLWYSRNNYTIVLEIYVVGHQVCFKYMYMKYLACCVDNIFIGKTSLHMYALQAAIYISMNTHWSHCHDADDTSFETGHSSGFLHWVCYRKAVVCGIRFELVLIYFPHLTSIYTHLNECLLDGHCLLCFILSIHSILSIFMT